MDNTQSMEKNSFIANVNLLAKRLELLLSLNLNLTDENLKALGTLSNLNLDDIINDLKKGSYLSGRKLDIVLLKNMLSYSDSMTDEEKHILWNDTSKHVQYDYADVVFTDDSQLRIVFIAEDGITPTTLMSSAELYLQLGRNIDLQNKAVSTVINTATNVITGITTRLSDKVGGASNINRVILHAVSGEPYKVQQAVYTWVDTTSALEVLSANINELVALGVFTSDFVNVSHNLIQLLEVAKRIPQLIDTYNAEDRPNGDATLYNNLNALMQIYSNLAVVLASPDNAIIASESAKFVETALNQIRAIHVATTYTVTPDQPASVSYNAGQNTFTFFIPKGEKGEAFAINAFGDLLDRSTYDTSPKDFSFFAYDTGLLYFKKSSANADWTDGVVFGVGPKGADGSSGIGVDTVAFLSSTHPSNTPAQADSTDTYRMLYTDGTHFDFQIKNSTSEFATLDQAKGGVATTVIMSPARVMDLITFITATETEAKIGTSNSKLMTPLRVQQALVDVYTKIAEAQYSANEAYRIATTAQDTALAGWGIQNVNLARTNTDSSSNSSKFISALNVSLDKTTNTIKVDTVRYGVASTVTNCVANCDCSKD